MKNTAQDFTKGSLSVTAQHCISGVFVFDKLVFVKLKHYHPSFLFLINSNQTRYNPQRQSLSLLFLQRKRTAAFSCQLSAYTFCWIVGMASSYLWLAVSITVTVCLVGFSASQDSTTQSSSRQTTSKVDGSQGYGLWYFTSIPC